MRKGIVAALTIGLLAAPALADVKAGVDAWSRGDYRQAVDEWRPLAIAGDADAQFNMGQAYKLGRGVPVDLAMAEEWYRKAAQQGHPQAADNYGLALFQNGKRDQAVAWLEKSSTRGEPRAQYVLATMFFNGDVVKRDWVRAYALMTRSSASGLDQASVKLAEMDKYISNADRQKGSELARRYETEAGRPIQGEVAAAPPRPGPMVTADLPPSSVESMVTETRPVRRPPSPRTAPMVQAPLPKQPVLKAPVPKPVVYKPPVPKPAAPGPRIERLQPVAASGTWRVQLGAFREPDGARRLWSQVAGRFPARQPYFVRAGAVTRLLVGPYASASDAARACGAIKPCVPVR